MWLYAFLGVLLIAFGILIHVFKQYRWISKYNRMTNEEKMLVDITGMAKLMGVVLYFDGFMLILATVLVFLGVDVPLTPIIVVLVVSLGFMTLFMQRYDGNLFDVNHKLKKGVFKKFLKSGSVTVIALVAVLAMIFVSTRPLDVEVNEEALVINGMYGTTIRYDEIVEVQWLNTLPKIEMRTNGADIGPHLKGHFKLESLGAVKLFVNKKYEHFILIKTQDQVVIFNMDLESLKPIYDQLMQK